MSGIFEALSGARGIRAAGKSAQNIAEYNAAVARQEAEAQRQKGTFEQKRQAKAAARARSALTAQIAAKGGLGAPVAADLAAEQAAELELENLLIGFEAETAARRAESQAELDVLSGKLAKQKGKAAARAANVQFGMQLAGLGTSFLTGFGGKKTPTTTQPVGTGTVLRP